MMIFRWPQFILVIKMKVYVKGQGTISLTKHNFVGQGGEGQVYARGGTAYKFYTDPQKMIPTAKVQDLSVLADPCIIKPLNIILNKSDKPIGYTMKFLSGTHSLCRLFTKSFRERHLIDNADIFSLVQKMRNSIKHIHKNDILIVDLNEMNFLISKDLLSIFFIDVDSYQTPNFPATAIMESIRDRHAKKNNFNNGTDWFSFAIVTFQMFIGIHPYKGKHQTIKSLDERMMQNVSVFHNGVTIPKICQPFDVMPQAYRNWYSAIFEKGLRAEPPSGAIATITIVTEIKSVVGSDKLEIIELEKYTEPVINCFHWNGRRIVLTAKGLYVGRQFHRLLSPNICLAQTAKLGHIIAAKTDGDTISLYNISTGKPIQDTFITEDMMMYDGRIYLKLDDVINELQFMELGTGVRVVAKKVANVLPNATRLFDGMAIQNMLGAYFVSLFPNSGMHYQIRIKEIESYKIIDAKYNRRVLMIVAEKNGKYDRFVLRFDDSFNKYTIRTIRDIHYVGLNFVVLDNNVCVNINEEEKIEVFKTDPNDNRITLIEDAIINGDMKLYPYGTQACFSKNNIVSKIQMK